MGILLKDRNGNEIDYSWPNRLRTKAIDNYGKEIKKVYYPLASLTLYFYEPLGGRIRIIDDGFYLASNEFWFTGVSDDYLKKYGYELNGGEYAIGMLILATRRLEIGKEYTNEELYAILAEEEGIAPDSEPESTEEV